MVKIETSGIKLSEIRPCDFCGGQIAPIFRILDIKMAVFNGRNVNSVLGTARILGGSLGLAEVMAPGADSPVEVCEDHELNDRLFACQMCMCHPLDVARALEKRNAAAARGATA